jgi:hypothetical protein
VNAEIGHHRGTTRRPPDQTRSPHRRRRRRGSARARPAIDPWTRSAALGIRRHPTTLYLQHAEPVRCGSSTCVHTAQAAYATTEAHASELGTMVVSADARTSREPALIAARTQLDWLVTHLTRSPPSSRRSQGSAASGSMALRGSAPLDTPSTLHGPRRGSSHSKKHRRTVLVAAESSSKRVPTVTSPKRRHGGEGWDDPGRSSRRGPRSVDIPRSAERRIDAPPRDPVPCHSHGTARAVAPASPSKAVRRPLARECARDGRGVALRHDRRGAARARTRRRPGAERRRSPVRHRSPAAAGLPHRTSPASGPGTG